MIFPKKITLENHGIEYEVRVSHWQKHGKNRLYINDLGLTYDLNKKEWLGKMTPQKVETARKVEKALSL